MKSNYNIFTEDEKIDVSKEIALVWSVANSLRGAYKSDKYKDVIIPMVIIRRFECALEETKQAVIDKFNSNPTLPDAMLCRVSGYPFYNTSGYTLKRLLDDSDAIAGNFKEYIKGFSKNIQTIIDGLEFEKEIDKLDKNNRLYNVVEKFSDMDFYPTSVNAIKMGYLFEEIIRRFSENAEAGDHYTPREVIRLLVNLLLAEGCDDILTKEGKVVKVMDAACGSGGMLSTTYDFIMRHNSEADVRLFGQEINDESYAFCLADMLIKGQDIKNIHGGDDANTLMYDRLEGEDMRLCIMNPPFGTPWGGKDAPTGQEKKVKDSKSTRFSAGLPGTGDSQLLFMQHAINKLSEKDGRAAIITNGSPLFSGGTTSGESQIRRWMIENDYIEAIIGLPSQLFYNTDIGIYVFILSKNKSEKRVGKIQLIDATSMWKPLRKSLGKKRREIDKDSIVKITNLYSDFEENECSKIFDKDDFLYKEYSVYQPLQRKGYLNLDKIAELESSTYFTANSNIYSETDLEMLEEMNPRKAGDEKKYQKMLKGKQFVTEVIAALKANACDTIYDDYSEFERHLKTIIKNIDGYSDSRLTGIAMQLSEIDKTAIIQKDKKGNIIIDTTTKDTELIKYTDDVDEYMAKEVLPHVPDAMWFFEEKADAKKPVIKTGAEFPFTRQFYKYTAPEKADDLLAQFMEIESGLASKIASLTSEV